LHILQYTGLQEFIMPEKTCLILHRKSANEPYVKEAVKAIRKEGIELRVLVPFNKAEKPRVVREALERGAERIVAGGGDGTINAVANALIGKGKEKPSATMGVFPLGTANDFARGCGLPLDDLTECLRIACTREARVIDVGKMNKHFFINVASLGFGAEITATTPVELKKKLGGGAYTLMGMVKAMNLTPYTGRLLIPGQDPIEGNLLFGAVGNNHFAGGGFDIAPSAELDDGLLDLTAIMRGPGISLSDLARELENPMSPGNRFVAYRQLAEFTIDADQPLHCNLDGEPVCKKKLRFSILPHHLKIAY
jgi:lipid kinase YegS